MKLRAFFLLLFCLWFGVPADAASRFWVGGTGEWNSSDTTHWAATTGGAGGQSVPSSADTVTLDGNSGGGTVTLNFGGTITIQSLTMGAFTGTFDNSVNNNPITVTATGTAFSGSGTAVRNIKLGSGPYTLTANTATWSFLTTTNLVFSGADASIIFTGTSGDRTFTAGNNLTYRAVSFAANVGQGTIRTLTAFTIGTITINAPNYWTLETTNVPTVTTLLSLVGTAANNIEVLSVTPNASASINVPSGQTASFVGFRDVDVLGNTIIASNSLNLGRVTGVTFLPPSGGAQCVGC